MVPANSTKGGMRAGVRIDFYVPPGAAASANKYVVDFQWQAEPAMQGISWWLTNSAGSVLDHGGGGGGIANGTKAWSLGTGGDPHTIWVTTNYSIGVAPFNVSLPQAFAYGLSAACTEPQPVSAPPSATPCTPNPCAAGCTCVVVGSGHSCINCPGPAPVNPCVPNPCGPNCTCTASGSAHACNCAPASGPTVPGASSGSGLLLVAGGLVVAAGGYLFLRRPHAAPASAPTHAAALRVARTPVAATRSQNL